MDSSYVSRMVNLLTTLAPDIVAAILDVNCRLNRRCWAEEQRIRNGLPLQRSTS